MTNATWIEPPPPQKGMGCFAKGCLILVVFAIILAIACCAGIYWGFKHDSAIVRGFYWLTQMHALADKPIAISRYEAPEPEIRAVIERWQNFEAAVRARQPAEIELTANDLNDLIASNPDTRDKMFAFIEGNRLRLQVSFPLGESLGRSGYYFNGDVTMESDGVESLAYPRLTNITINGHRLPADLLDWRFRSRSLRDYFAENQYNWRITTVQIANGKLILKTKGE